MAEPLFDHWPEMEARIGAADHVLLACDFDGTLSPIVPRPEDAYILPACAEALRELSELPTFDVAIVSGRALADVRERVGLKSAIYSGNHGMEIQGPGLVIEDEVTERSRRVMRELRQALEPVVGQVRGAFVEDKAISLSVHYRMTPDELEQEIQERVLEATADAVAKGDVIVVQGKKVLDIRPAAARDKGAALRFVMEALAKGTGDESRLAIYVGDDTTDEDAFREVNRTGGVSVLAGPAERATAAQYRVESPEDVAEFLKRLVRIEARA